MSPDVTRCHLLPYEHITIYSQILTSYKRGSVVGRDVHFADTSGCVGLGLAEPVGVDGLVGVGFVDVWADWLEYPLHQCIHSMKARDLRRLTVIIRRIDWMRNKEKASKRSLTCSYCGIP